MSEENKIDPISKLTLQEITEILKIHREIKWSAFNKMTPEEKLAKLEKIVVEKEKKQTCPLAVNLRNPESNFDSIIFELISKAQTTQSNYYRLMLAFPEYVKLWEEWQNSENEEEFFEKYKV